MSLIPSSLTLAFQLILDGRPQDATQPTVNRRKKKKKKINFCCGRPRTHQDATFSCSPDIWVFRVRGTRAQYGFSDVFENVKPGGLTDAGGSEAPS
jgi:hypothetical protein